MNWIKARDIQAGDEIVLVSDRGEMSICSIRETSDSTFPNHVRIGGTKRLPRLSPIDFVATLCDGDDVVLVDRWRGF